MQSLPPRGLEVKLMRNSMSQHGDDNRKFGHADTSLPAGYQGPHSFSSLTTAGLQKRSLDSDESPSRPPPFSSKRTIHPYERAPPLEDLPSLVGMSIPTKLNNLKSGFESSKKRISTPDTFPTSSKNLGTAFEPSYKDVVIRVVQAGFPLRRFDNFEFGCVVEQSLPLYFASDHPRRLQKIVLAIMETIRINGGKFLTFDMGWKEVDAYTTQAFILGALQRAGIVFAPVMAQEILKPPTPPRSPRKEVSNRHLVANVVTEGPSFEKLESKKPRKSLFDGLEKLAAAVAEKTHVVVHEQPKAVPVKSQFLQVKFKKPRSHRRSPA